MDVFLVPVAENRYALYCEVPVDPIDESADQAVAGRFKGFVQRFRATLARIEHERAHRHESPPAEAPEAGTWRTRLRDRALCWLSEKVAEQRLLWHLRRQEEASLMFPADMIGDAGRVVLRDALKRDADRHRLWLAVHSVLAIVTGAVLFLVPGPNLVAYYFVFRMVGHYFSWRGARQGLDRVTWRLVPSEALEELRRARHLKSPLREREVDAIASRLRLERLAAFFEQTALRDA